MIQKNSFFNSNSKILIMKLLLICLSFTFVIEIKEKNYVIKHYANLYLIKKKV